MTYLPIILAVVLVLVIAGIIIGLMMNKEAERKALMLEKIKGQAVHDAGDSIEDAQNKRRAEISKKLKDEKEGDEGKTKKKNTLSLMLLQTGRPITVLQYWLFSFASMAALFGLAKAMDKGPVMLGAAAVIGLFGIPRFVIKKMAAKRQKTFLEVFPDALEATVRLLKAGMPVAEAIAMIAREYDGPVGDEMGRIYDKQKIGIPLHEAALEATDRIPLPEMQMFATGLAIQAQTGSSLSEVLTNLSSVIRSRFRLKRKVKALSSEAVASASIIASLPILVATALYFVNYDYIEVLFTEPFGNFLLTCAIVWMGVGIFAMKIMINFKV